MGAPEDVIEAARAVEKQEDDFYVWKENWAAVLIFLGLATQWRLGATGRYIGLDYAAVQAVMNMRCVKKFSRKALFNDIQIMEYAALDVLRKSDDRA